MSIVAISWVSMLPPAAQGAAALFISTLRARIFFLTAEVGECVEGQWTLFVCSTVGTVCVCPVNCEQAGTRQADGTWMHDAGSAPDPARARLSAGS